jgi:hypothetical protein
MFDWYEDIRPVDTGTGLHIDLPAVARTDQSSGFHETI